MDKGKGAPQNKLTFINLPNCSLLLQEYVDTKATAKHSYVRSNGCGRLGNTLKDEASVEGLISCCAGKK